MRIRRVEFEDESQENGVSSLRPMHPIIISRRFNRVRDDLKRTLVPPRNDPELLRRFRRGPSPSLPLPLPLPLPNPNPQTLNPKPETTIHAGNYAVPARELAGISANYSIRQ